MVDTQVQDATIDIDVNVPGVGFIDKVSQMLQEMMAEQDPEGLIYDSEA